MMRLATIVIAAALAGCKAGAPPAGSAAGESTIRSGWSIAPDGDLNSLFDCLGREGKTLVAAHRGGPAPGFPENAIETFENMMGRAPAFLEIDVATSADGILYLMHDDTLDRTTSGAGAIESVAWKEVSAMQLEDSTGRATPYHPPSFAEALAWAEGRTILEIDFKKTTRYEDVIAEITRQQAEDRVILIAYTTAQARRLHRLAPRVMISLSVSTQSDLNNAVAAGVPADRLLGFTGIEDPKPRLFSMLGAQDIEVVFGTLGGRDSIDNEIEAAGNDSLYADLSVMGVDVIATDRPVAAQAALEIAGRAAIDGQCGIARAD